MQDVNTVGVDVSPAQATQLRQACERCWKRKQKCDRRAPTCTKCFDADAVCRPRTAVISIGDDEDSTLQIVSGEGYINGLKRRIRHLEALQESKRQRRPNPGSPGGVSDNGVSLQDRARSRLSQSLATAPALGHLTLSTIAADVTYSQRTSARQLSMTQLIDAALATNDESPPGVHHRDLRDVQDLLRSQNLASMSVPSLSRDIGSALMRMYLQYILPRLPFIDSTMLMQSFEYVMAENGRAEPQPRQSYQSVLVHLAIATVAAAAGTTLEMAQLAAQSHARAVRLLPVVLARGESVEAVQCLTSFAIHALYSSQGGSVWHLLGVAITKAISLGLHRIQHSSSGSETPQRADAKLLFWVLYVLDRDVSAALGKPVTIHDCDISTPKLERNEAMGGSDTEHRHHLVELVENMHLLQEIQSDVAKPDIYFSTVLSSWRSGSSVHKLQARDDTACELALRLQCRLLISISHQRLRSPALLPVVSGPSASSLSSETLDTSLAWLQCLDNQCLNGIHYASMLDVYEVATAGIICHLIRQHWSGVPTIREDHVATRIHALSMSLLSLFSTRFSCARELRWTLLTSCEFKPQGKAFMGDAIADSIPTHRNLVTEINAKQCVPRSLRELCCRPLVSVPGNG